jgi:hypothetical protein
MTSQIHLTQLKDYLSGRSRDELIADISVLFGRFAAVKEYYEVKLTPEGLQRSCAKYKEIISNEFFPKRGFGKARLSVAKKAITDFGKVSSSPEYMADLLLYFVETGIEYTSTYGDIDEAFYRSLVGMYSRALELIFDNKLAREFSDRCESIIASTVDIGWLLNENLSEIHAQYFES